MDLDEASQDRTRFSRALLGIALVIVLLVAAGALFLVWRPDTYTDAVAALTDNTQEDSQALVGAGATPAATGEKSGDVEAVAVPTPRTSSGQAKGSPGAAASNASVERVEQQQGGLEQRLAATERRLARLDWEAAVVIKCFRIGSSQVRCGCTQGEREHDCGDYHFHTWFSCAG